MKPIWIKIGKERYDLIMLLTTLSLSFAGFYGYFKKDYLMIVLSVLIQFGLIVFLVKTIPKEKW